MTRRNRTWRTTRIVLAGLWAAGCGGAQPTDDALIERFASRRDGFERLLEISRRDAHLRRIAHDWCEDVDGGRHFGPTPGVLDVEDWGEYRELFYALELGDGLEVVDGVRYLLATTRGHGNARTVRGYAYAPADPATLPSCDREADETPPPTCFRPLGEGWYLFVRRQGGP